MKSKNIIKLSFFIAFILIIFLILTSLIQKDVNNNRTLAINPVLKSEFDSTTYSQVNLKNGIQTLIVTRDNQHKTNILVGVKIGLINDPDFIPGLSHLLEHLVISGKSQGYKELGGFREFVKHRGGSIEANISRFNTIYDISIDDKYHKEMMERLADLINKPSFEEDIVQKEIQIIDAEANGFFPTLDYKINRAGSLFNSTDNFTNNSFPGNKVSLYSNRNITEITSLLGDHHASFYHPDNIKILIISSIKSDDIAKNVDELFGAITKKSNLHQKGKERIADNTKQGYVYSIKDKDYNDNLIIKIPLNNQYPIFAGDFFSSSLINEIFYGTSDMSIYSKLIKTGYISNLSVKLPYGFGYPDIYSSTLTVTLLLTPKGKKHESDLLNVFFAHFSELNTYDSISNLQKAAEKKTKTGHSPFISHNPRALLERFMYAPIDQITDFSPLNNKFEFTKNIIGLIQPSHSTVIRFDNSDNHRYVSKFDNIKFSKEPFKHNSVKVFDNTSSHSAPSIERHPYLTSDKPIHEKVFADNTKIIVKRESVSFDASFLNARISSSFKLSNQHEFIYLQALKKLTNLNSITLPLSCQKFGNCIIDFSDFGEISFELGGNAIEARDQLDYSIFATEKFYHLDNNDKAVNDALKNVCDMDFLKISNTHQAFQRLTKAYTNKNAMLWNNIQHWNCEGVNREGFTSFYEKFINESQVTINASNAVPDTTMRAFTEQLATMAGRKSKGYILAKENDGIPEKAINIESPIKNGGEMVMSAYIYPSKDTRSMALTRILVPIVDAQYFSIMRYVYNTGYLAETKFDTIDKYPTLVIASTSYEMKAKEMQLLHDEFIADFIKNIEIKIPNDIEPLKNLVVSELTDSSVLNSQCMSSNSCKSELEATVKSITREELIVFAKNLLAK
jgi:secreted Zn-dependent insulinase-like peptidase